MGSNSSSLSPLRAAIVSGDLDALKALLSSSLPEPSAAAAAWVEGAADVPPAATREAVLNRPLNRKLDTALILAARAEQYHLLPYLMESGCHLNAENQQQETVLDVVLNRSLPPDGDILHHHFCPYSHIEGGQSYELPDVVRSLLEAGAKGYSLQRLILHTVKDPSTIRVVCELASDLHRRSQFRLCGLLLQVCVWFEQHTNLMVLLHRGVDPTHFWSASFPPTIVPNNTKRASSVAWPRGEEGEYTLPTVPDTNALQSLKLSFVQDWRADWNDGENPKAQYRAGLHVTPQCALIFTKAANRYGVLSRIMKDVTSYLPPLCGGPELQDGELLSCLVMAGYSFGPDEMLHLQLKFNVDFEKYVRYVSKPAPLKHLCRIRIRLNFKTNVYHALEQIPCLPAGIKQYISLESGVEL